MASNKGVELSDDDLKWANIQSRLRFDFLRRKMTTDDDPFIKKRFLTFKGGVLADQMVFPFSYSPSCLLFSAC